MSASARATWVPTAPKAEAGAAPPSRSPHGVSLTQAGEGFCRQARPIVQTTDRAVREAQSNAGPHPVRAAFDEQASTSGIPTMLEAADAGGVEFLQTDTGEFVEVYRGQGHAQEEVSFAGNHRPVDQI